MASWCCRGGRHQVSAMCIYLIEEWIHGEHLISSNNTITDLECEYMIKYYAVSDAFRILALFLAIIPVWRRAIAVTRFLHNESLFTLFTSNCVVYRRTLCLLCIHCALATMFINDCAALLMQTVSIAEASGAIRSSESEACSEYLEEGSSALTANLIHSGKFIYQFFVFGFIIASVVCIQFLWLDLIQIVSFASLFRSYLTLRIASYAYAIAVITLLIVHWFYLDESETLRIVLSMVQMVAVIFVAAFGYKYSVMVSMTVTSLSDDTRESSIVKLRTLVHGITKFVILYILLSTASILATQILQPNMECPLNEVISMSSYLMLVWMTRDIVGYFEKTKAGDWFSRATRTIKKASVVPVQKVVSRISSSGVANMISRGGSSSFTVVAAQQN